MSARRDAHAAYLSLTLREQGLPTAAAMPDTPLRQLIFDRWLPASLFALIATPNIFLFADMFGDGSSALNLSRQALTSVFVVLMASLFVVRRDRVGPRSALGPAVVAITGTAALLWWACLARRTPLLRYRRRVLPSARWAGHRHRVARQAGTLLWAVSGGAGVGHWWPLPLGPTSPLSG